MKTPKYQLTVRAVAAAAIALAGSFYAVPALAETGTDTPTPVPSPSASSSPAAPAEAKVPGAPAPAVAPEITDAGLAEAIQRDLGMTLGEFNAAGQLARTAADAVPSLRGLPGYVGITLKDGKIFVEGSGAELRARVNGLNGTGAAALFALAAPPPGSSAAGPTKGSSAAPAADPSAAGLVASSTEQLFQAYVREVGTAGLQAVTYSGGSFIIRTGGTNVAESGGSRTPDPQSAPPATDALPGKISPADFVSRYANVQLAKGAPIKTEEDFFGGQGIVIDNMTICSAGFGAFDPAGLPLMLTAGHCAEDGTASRADVEPATAATAGGATTPLPAVRKLLGTFGFSQFGGPHNSPVLNPKWNTGDPGGPGNVGTDIAVIKDLNGGLKFQPAATTWANAANPGPTAVKIIGTVAPFQGQAVCRSGRTTGWSCGTVAETGIYVVGGRTAAAGDVRAFKGFLSYDVQSSGGDSGGPWISGNFAVGTHSAGEPQGASQNFAVATTLDDALNHIPGGVQLQLFLNKPELAAPANSGAVVAGRLITGHVPAAPASEVAPHSKVRITVGAQKLDVPVDAAGNWAFRAPLPSGQLAFSAETVNGFSHSGPAFFKATVAPAPLPAPGITTPAGTALPALDRIAGTGMPGATVVLSGGVAGSGTVGLDGRWSIRVADKSAFGKVSVTAVLTTPGEPDSPATTSTYTVIPPVPVVSSIRPGSHLRQDALSADIAGTAVDGADVRVAVDGTPVGPVQAGSGRWSTPFPAGLAAGAHTLTVTQVIDTVTSHAAEIAFIIDAGAVSAGTPNQPPAQYQGAPAQQQPAAEQPAGQQPAAQQPAQQPAAQQPGGHAQPAGPAQVPVPPSDASVTVRGAAPESAPLGRTDPWASMGASGLLPAAGLGAGALLLGAAFVAFGRRRRAR